MPKKKGWVPEPGKPYRILSCASHPLMEQMINELIPKGYDLLSFSTTGDLDICYTALLKHELAD